MGSQGVSQCFGCGVVGEGEEDTEDGNFYCFACWLIYHAARARLRRDSAQAAGVCSQHAWYGGEGDCARKCAGSSAGRAFVWKRERSGHDRVCAGYAGR